MNLGAYNKVLFTTLGADYTREVIIRGAATIRGYMVYICLYVLTFGMQGYFGLVSARTSSSLERKFTHMTELWRNCHIFEGVKSHICLYPIPIRDRT